MVVEDANLFISFDCLTRVTPVGFAEKCRMHSEYRLGSGRPGWGALECRTEPCHNRFETSLPMGDDFTRTLNALQRGEPCADEHLLALVYRELRQLAKMRMARQRLDQTLQPTALVHEAYLKLMGGSPQPWENRRHFFGAAAQAMRQILVDIARRKQAARHGGGQERVAPENLDLVAAGDVEDFLDLHTALDQLAVEDPVEADIVKLRYFVGLENHEVAELLGLSLRSVERGWAYARAWLFRAMKSAEPRWPSRQKKSGQGTGRNRPSVLRSLEVVCLAVLCLALANAA